MTYVKILAKNRFFGQPWLINGKFFFQKEQQITQIVSFLFYKMKKFEAKF